MKLKLTYSLVLLTTLILFQSLAQQTVKVTSSGIGYLEYLPDGYHNNSNKYPVVISLHGIKERGTTSTDIETIKAGVPKVANVGLPKYVKYGTKYPFILISPQLKSSYGSWPADYVMEVVNYVKKNLRIDERRIYLTGLSLGGGGVWRTAAAYPSVFAAIGPICPASNAVSSACAIAKENLPVWDFHGDKDGTVSHQVSVKMINAMNGCSPKCNPLAKLTIYAGAGHIIWDKAYKDTNLLDWMLSHVKGTLPVTDNAKPVAKAGSDITVTLPTSSATINGSATDADGTIASYSWSQLSGPSSATLSNKTTAKLTASKLVAGTYKFQLKVADNDGATDTDDVIVTVKASTTNESPVVSAGSDKTITLPTNSVTITGSASDSDGSIASYQWSKTSGGSATLSGTTSKTLTASKLAAGTYKFKLTVKDNKGASKSDEVLVTVKESSAANKAPIASAGKDKTIYLPTTSTVVAGSGTDSDGSIASYQWTKVSGGSCTLANTTTSSLKVSGLKEGNYIFMITVKDNKGATDTDKMLLVVKNGSSASVNTAQKTTTYSSR